MIEPKKKEGFDVKKIESELKKNSLKTGKSKKNGCKKAIFLGLTVFITFVALLILLAVLLPDFFVVIINIIWVIVFCIVVVFVFLGILVMFGLKREAERLINIMLEGSLTIIDIMHFFKEMFFMFKKYLQELLFVITPVFSYLLIALIYVGLMYLYKYVGKDNDITYFTIALTAVLTFLVGVFNRPTKEKPQKFTIFKKIKAKFIAHFKDALEVMIFVFFLTMDSTKLFFLPPSLNVELHAKLMDYDLMIRSFTFDNNLRFTVTLVMLAISIEMIRNIIRIVVLAIKNFRLSVEYLEKNGRTFTTAEVIKLVIRESVKHAMDDLLKFITFTTVLIAVFLAFPRLKLLSMVIASMTALLLDFVIIERLKTEKKGEDLISRTIAKVFRL